MAHPSHESDQSSLIRMGRISAEAGDPSTNIDTLAFQLHVAAPWAILLYRSAGRAPRLESGEDHVMPGVTQHGLEIIDHAPGTAHAVAGNHYGGLPGLG